jgi:CheY-like chemotaxis protein
MTKQTETSWIIELILPKVNETIRVQLSHPIVLGRHDDEHKINVDLTPHGAEEAGVSRRHLQIHTDGKNLLVTDLNSGNGTIVNGTRLEPEKSHPVKDGDKLYLGRLEIQVRVIIAPGYGSNLHTQRSIQTEEEVVMGKGQLVMIVEDDQEVAGLLSTVVNKTGYKSAITYDVTSAIRMFREKRPSAVILDLMLPDISGLELCRYIRRDGVGNRTPIIVMSAAKTEENVNKAMQAGANIFLGKPMSTQELRHVLSSLINEQEKGVNSMKTKHLVGTAPLKAVSPESRKGTAVLFIQGHGDAPITVPLRHPVTLGRTTSLPPKNHIDLTRYEAVDMGVSRVHATLSYDDGIYYIEDAGSVNGSSLNGEPLRPRQPTPLKNADEIRLGQLRAYVYFLMDNEVEGG